MELSMALVQMKGLKCRIDDILNVTTYDEYADLRGLHVDHKNSGQPFQLKELQAIKRPASYIGMKTGNTEQRKGIVTVMGT